MIRHIMETFSVLLTLCEGIHWWTAVPPNNGTVMQSFDVFYKLTWNRLVLMWRHCCKTSTFGDIKALTCDNACRGHHGTSAWPCSMHEPSTHCDYSSMKRCSSQDISSHCLNLWRFIINWDTGNIFQWNLNKINIFSFTSLHLKFRLQNVAFFLRLNVLNNRI